MELLSADPGLIVWTIVTFLLLLGILWKFAWNPILGALDAREQAIQKTIDDAERLQLDAAFREACTTALQRLAADGCFANIPNLMGYVVQSPLDPRDELVANQARTTAVITGQ